MFPTGNRKQNLAEILAEAEAEGFRMPQKHHSSRTHKLQHEFHFLFFFCERCYGDSILSLNFNFQGTTVLMLPQYGSQ